MTKNKRPFILYCDSRCSNRITADTQSDARVIAIDAGWNTREGDNETIWTCPDCQRSCGLTRGQYMGIRGLRGPDDGNAWVIAQDGWLWAVGGYAIAGFLADAAVPSGAINLDDLASLFDRGASDRIIRRMYITVAELAAAVRPLQQGYPYDDPQLLVDSLISAGIDPAPSQHAIDLNELGSLQRIVPSSQYRVTTRTITTCDGPRRGTHLQALGDGRIWINHIGG